MIFDLMSFASFMKGFGNVLIALLILLVMITVHEFGHYIAGKIFKFKINEFAIGFGPAIYKKTKKNGEIFSIRALPLGGYCAFEGEENENSDPNAFNNKKPWQRIIVLISGAFMNVVLATLIIIISFFSYGQLLLYIGGIDKVEGDNFYNEYAFQKEDIIISSDGRNVFLTSDLMDIVKGKEKGDLINFKVNRKTDGIRSEVEIKIALRTTPSFENLNEVDKLFESLGLSKNEEGKPLIYSTNYKFGFFQTIGRAFAYGWTIAGTIFTVLGQLLTGKLGMSALGGPVSTIAMTSQIVSGGLQSIFEITAFIGINLGVFNLLPLPALDGSKVVFTGIEWVRGKPVNRKIENYIHAFGFIFLLGFAVLVDLLKVF